MRFLGGMFGRDPMGVLFAAAFLLAAAPFGVLHAMLVPVGQIADEPAHGFRAYALAHGQFVGRRADYPQPGGPAAMTTVDVDTILAVIMLRSIGASAKPLSWKDLSIAALSDWSRVRQPYIVGAMGGYFPAFYLPAAATIAVGERLGVHPLATIQAARLVNLGCFLLLGVTALLAARRGRALLLCVLAVPMSVALAASLNEDGLLIATAVLAAALLTRVQAGGVAWMGVGWDWWAAAAGLLAVAMAKPPYLPLFLLLLMPLPWWGQWRWAAAGLAVRAGRMALLALPVLAWAAFAQHEVLGVIGHVPYAAGPLWPGQPGQLFNATDPAAQTRVLLAHPDWIPRLVESSLPFRVAMGEMIGVLGWLALKLPDWLYSLWAGVILVALASETVGGRGGAWRAGAADMAATTLACVASYALVCVSLYLTWTPVGFDHVEGVQGRYVLPLVPFLALVQPQIGLPGVVPARLAGLGAPLAAAVAGMLAMPAVFLWAYYLRAPG
jgi:hypothetical protein